jgi:4-amino-4-deoxy-L-arabinose transferase-like glycosyltransferase
MKLFLLLIVSFILFFNNLGGIALWDPDEPRQAIMAREMMDRHDYVHPYLNGQPYLEKPPLYPWMIIMTAKAKGALDEFSSRFPAALSATLLLIATYYVGCSLVGAQAGFLSALVLATNYQFLSNARESVMDMTFACFIGLTICLNYAAVVRGKRLYFILSFIPSVLAVLAKGPAGLVLPAVTTFFYLISRKSLKRFIVPLGIGCLLATALSSIWFLLAGPEYIKEFILHQNITRYTNAFDHIEDLFYYFHKLFFNFLPWSILLPFALYHAFKKRLWFPLIWFLSIFLFFELSKSKRAIYLLSCYPACALLVGIYLKDRWSWLLADGKTGKLVACFAVVLACLPIAALVALRVVASPVVAVFNQEAASLYLYIAVLVLAGATLFYSIVRKSAVPALSVLFFYFVFVGFFYNAFYMPVMDRNFKSPRLIADQLANLKEGRDIYTYGFSSAGIIFYIGKPIHVFTNFNEIKDKKNDILLIVEDEQSQHMEKDLNSLFLPVSKAHYEKEHYTMYVRRNGR